MPPLATQIHPGTPVSIILKADQRTGRQVQGLVADVLTIGNHPRGIKVRLVDGRIGRVQSLASPSTSLPPPSTSQISAASTTLSDPHADNRAREEEIRRDLEIQDRVRGPERARRENRGGRAVVRGGNYTDVRLEAPLPEPAAQLDLMAFARRARVKKGKRGGGVTGADTHGAVTATQDRGGMAVRMGQSEGDGGGREVGGRGGDRVVCPVCGIFEGDEVAVARHVEEHFS